MIFFVISTCIYRLGVQGALAPCRKLIKTRCPKRITAALVAIVNHKVLNFGSAFSLSPFIAIAMYGQIFNITQITSHS